MSTAKHQENPRFPRPFGWVSEVQTAGQLANTDEHSQNYSIPNRKDALFSVNCSSPVKLRRFSCTGELRALGNVLTACNPGRLPASVGAQGWTLRAEGKWQERGPAWTEWQVLALALPAQSCLGLWSCPARGSGRGDRGGAGSHRLSLHRPPTPPRPSTGREQFWSFQSRQRRAVTENRYHSDPILNFVEFNHLGFKNPSD